MPSQHSVRVGAKEHVKEAEKILTSQNILQFPYLSNMSRAGITKPSRD